MATRKRTPATTAEPGTDAVAKHVSPPAEKQRMPSENSFSVVGIGASAGGLAAIEEFLAALPAGKTSGMAFVLVQHLDPDHESLLLDLVKRYTDMDVAWAANGMAVQPGFAYVMPPNTEITLVDGRLVVAGPVEPRGQRLPINHFFRSLATDLRERAVGIVLSGTGSDGALGLRAIKGEGGMAIAQTPGSAAYDGMPRSAIATGLVDFVLAPADMPEQLFGYMNRAFTQTPEAKGAGTADPLLEVLHILRNRTGHDFTHYKANTLGRRVARRMAVTRIDAMDDYIGLLKRDALEVETLFRELLIGVTSFFRDGPAFEALAAEALPGLIAAHSSGDPVRVWVPGCSTGEEAYSIAMLLLEQAGSAQRNVPVQVFATDIDITAIESARAGMYPGTLGEDISPERLERFFVREGDGYRISKSVRDCMVFAKQDVIKDPPFSKVDLISCRNLLIYMDTELQQKLMPLFHYAIRPGGYLFLGSSETIGVSTDLFAPVDKKWRIFRRQGAITPLQRLTTSMPLPDKTTRGLGQAPGETPARVRVRELAEGALLDRHVPASVIINADGDVLYIHGHTGNYLEPAAGEPSASIFKMAREGLRLELSAGVRRALTEKKPVRYDRLRVKTKDGVSVVNLVIEPLSTPETVADVLMVLFEEATADSEAPASTLTKPSTPDEQRIADLDRELTVKEEYLRSTVEELETSNEELKSTNEEMQSANEELQSTNEELETSREELQSINEELVTVNSELQQKIEEVSTTNNDMNNMIAGTGIGTLFVDRKLLVRRFTPAVTAIMNLIPADVGRPISDITSLLKSGDLVGAVNTVLDTLATIETLVETGAGRVYQMRVQPYRTLENVIEGAVLTFVDVTDQQHLKSELDEVARTASDAGELAQSVIDTIREPQLVLDGNLAVITVNRAFLVGFHQERDAVVGRPLREIGDGAWHDPELLDLLEKVLPTKKKLDDYRLGLPDGATGPRTVTLNALELVRAPQDRRLILLTVTDMGGDT